MISAQTGVTPPAATPDTAAARPPKRAQMGDFETYLRMLTTQLRNQDPMNPMESTEFSVQLATFSAVEQQVRTNQLLESMAGEKAVSTLSSYAGWIGLEALAPADVWFNGAPVPIAPRLAAGADRGTLVVTAPDGTEVSRQAVTADGSVLDWAGVTSDGAPLPRGSYRLTLESHLGGRLLSTDPVPAYAVVREVSTGPDGGVLIELDGGATVPAAAVLGLRRAG
jgi:flagellar basal-body rod modification protein FlgD